MSDGLLDDVRDRIMKLEACYVVATADLSEIKTSIALLKANYDNSKLLIQWVVFPLVVILGGLVGVKILFPVL